MWLNIIFPRAALSSVRFSTISTSVHVCRLGCDSRCRFAGLLGSRNSPSCQLGLVPSCQRRETGAVAARRLSRGGGGGGDAMQQWRQRRGGGGAGARGRGGNFGGGVVAAARPQPARWRTSSPKPSLLVPPPSWLILTPPFHRHTFRNLSCPACLPRQDDVHIMSCASQHSCLS